jgi:uncharacterized protein (DUF1778 family)
MAEEKTGRLGVRIPESLVWEIRKAAVNERKTMTDWLIEAIQDRLAKQSEGH